MNQMIKTLVCLSIMTFIASCAVTEERSTTISNANPISKEDENLPDIRIVSKWNNPLSLRLYRSGVEHHTFLSKANKTEVGYSIYLPPKYYTSDIPYPVLYFLGGMGNNENVQQRRWAHYLDPTIEWDKLPPMIVVWPNPMNNSWYMDSRHMKVETMIIRELIPHVDSTYRTYPDRENRWIGGMSMGGLGCLKFAFKYPELFSSVVSYAPAINMDEEREEDHPANLVAKNTEMARMIRVRIVCGDKDDLYEGARDFYTFLNEKEVPAEFETILNVGHNLNEMFRQVGVKGLRFHMISDEK